MLRRIFADSFTSREAQLNNPEIEHGDLYGGACANVRS